MTNTIPFGKSYTSPHDLVSLLQLRGLSIPDALKAEHYLEHIGYYRLSAYMHPLLEIPKEHHLYKRGATFSKVMMLYRFDKKLRLLLFNELEKIEVAVRSAIVNIGSSITGNPFWMTDSANFVNSAKFHKTMNLINQELYKSKEDFIIHFKKHIQTHTHQHGLFQRYFHLESSQTYTTTSRTRKSRKRSPNHLDYK